MAGYTVKRILQVIPAMLIVSFVVFMIIHLVPGDPVRNLLGNEATPETIEAMREELGLNKPLATQYLTYMKGLFRGDLGTSIFSKQPVTKEIASRFPVTFKIAVGATLVSLVLGCVFGIIAALNQNKVLDSMITALSLLSVSIPVFFLAILLVLFFSLKLGWFPSVGVRTWKGYVLPILALGLQSTGIISRTTRSSMLDVLKEDYMRTAKASGIPGYVIVLKNGLKNALIPIITVAGIRFGTLLTGAAITETVFSISGIGRYLVEAVLQRDYPVVQGTILVLSVLFVLVNLLTDLLYGAADPRISYA